MKLSLKGSREISLPNGFDHNDLKIQSELKTPFTGRAYSFKNVFLRRSSLSLLAMALLGSSLFSMAPAFAKQAEPKEAVNAENLIPALNAAATRFQFEQGHSPLDFSDFVSEQKLNEKQPFTFSLKEVGNGHCKVVREIIHCPSDVFPQLGAITYTFQGIGRIVAQSIGKPQDNPEFTRQIKAQNYEGTQQELRKANEMLTVLKNAAQVYRAKQQKAPVDFTEFVSPAKVSYRDKQTLGLKQIKGFETCQVRTDSVYCAKDVFPYLFFVDYKMDQVGNIQYNAGRAQ
ncbi:MAG: hypothetical protein K2X66_06915 [Cyanobacteria bacterium]|nr:hypothetical protein [Cyanobacteriota bacterium]